jgi:carbamoyltransferase
LDALLNGNHHYRRYVSNIRKMLTSLGFEWGKFEFEPVEHHLAHASSCYHLSGFKEKTAIMGVDGKGEYATTFFGYGEKGVID